MRLLISLHTRTEKREFNWFISNKKNNCPLEALRGDLYQPHTWVKSYDAEKKCNEMIITDSNELHPRIVKGGGE